MLKIRKGDNVKVMRGKDSGKEGDVLAIIKGVKNTRVIIKGVNIVKKTQKPNAQLGIKGGITEIEKGIDISNVMLIDKKTGKPSRVGFKIDEKTGKKLRFIKKSGETIK